MARELTVKEIMEAVNQDGYYISEIGNRCFPIVIDEKASDFLVVDADCSSYAGHAAEIKGGKNTNAAFEAYNMIPAKKKGIGTPNLYHAVKLNGFAVLERDGKLFASAIENHGNYSGDLLASALANIVSGNGVVIDEIPKDANKMIDDVFLDVNGNVIGKDKGCIVLEGFRTGGNRIMKYYSSNKEYLKVVPGKKSPLFKEIDSVRRSVNVLVRPAFTTASGLTICNPIRILSKN